MQKKVIFSISLIIISACSGVNETKEQNLEIVETAVKINGVSYEMPPNPVDEVAIGSVKRVNADWVAMIPYAVTRKQSADVSFSLEGGWWGESGVGMTECVKMARSQGLKTMVKPHVWVVGQGWPGDFDLEDESDWIIWQESYADYILTYAKLAQDLNVDLFCIGTEYRKAVAKRTKFWKSLIKEVRKVYTGPITYAANWDNYEKVNFWSELDYIGIDAYFPLSMDANPKLRELKTAWKPIEEKLESLSEKHKKPILFTEYGYKSIEYANAGFWRYDEDTVKTSTKTQDIAYQALFETIWQNEWMAGGFFWKWHLYTRDGSEIGGEKNRRYTPQGKSSEKIISEWYSK